VVEHPLANSKTAIPAAATTQQQFSRLFFFSMISFQDSISATLLHNRSLGKSDFGLIRHACGVKPAYILTEVATILVTHWPR